MPNEVVFSKSTDAGFLGAKTAVIRCSDSFASDRNGGNVPGDWRIAIPSHESWRREPSDKEFTARLRSSCSATSLQLVGKGSNSWICSRTRVWKWMNAGKARKQTPTNGSYQYRVLKQLVINRQSSHCDSARIVLHDSEQSRWCWETKSLRVQTES